MNQNTLRILNKYYDDYSYLGKKDFIKFVSEEDPELGYFPPPKKDLIKWYESKTSKDTGKQITKKRNIKIKKYRVQSVPGSYQMDLVFFYLDIPWLMLIHVPSRYVWLYKLKNKKVSEVFDCLVDWFYQEQSDHSLKYNKINSKVFHRVPASENERFVNTITSDQEPAFMSDKVQNFCKKHGIKYYVKDTSEHYPLLILDSAVRKIKDLFQYNLSNDHIFSTYDIDLDNENDVKRFIDRLDMIVYKSLNQYNKKPSNSLHGLMPVEAFYSEDYQNYVDNRDSEHNSKIKEYNDKIASFNIGDYVRVKERKTNKIQKARYYSSKIYRIIGKFRFSYQIGLIENGKKIEIQPLSDFRFKPYELEKVSSSAINTKHTELLNNIKQNKINIRSNILKDKDFHLNKINKIVKPIPPSAITTRSKRIIKPNIIKDYVYDF